MSRALITINTPEDRARALHWVKHVSAGSRVEFKKARRTLPQNDRMWAMLTDIAEQKLHCGNRLTPNTWKILMMHGCGLEVETMPSLDGTEMIPFGQSSSDLGKEEASDLISFIFAWGDENGVRWSDPALRSLLQAAE